MKKIILLCAAFCGLTVIAAEVEYGGGQVLFHAHDQISEFESMNRWFQYMQDREKLIQQGRLNFEKSSGTHAMYDFPLTSTLSQNGYYGISNFVDQNLNFPNQLLDYSGGNRTYDLSSGYNHQGIDYFTWPYAWYKMDQDQVHIVAAEAGTITTKIDGNYDRSCGFNDPNDEGWNAVYITHSDGSYVFYGHMKSGSLTDKSVGQTVEVGEYLGVVGSSGTSTGPHLHFETYDAMNHLVEPYFGPANDMNDDSWWREQPPYYESKINQLIVHSTDPDLLDCASVNEESPSEVAFFGNGELVFLTAYYRDQLSSQTTFYELLDQNGSVYSSWNHSTTQAHYAASYWYWTRVLPATGGNGRWTFRAIYDSEVYEQYFWMGDLIFENSFE